MALAKERKYCRDIRVWKTECFQKQTSRERKAEREKMFEMFVEIVALMLNPLPEEVKSLKTKSLFFHIQRGNEIHKPPWQAGGSRTC